MIVKDISISGISEKKSLKNNFMEIGFWFKVWEQFCFLKISVDVPSTCLKCCLSEVQRTRRIIYYFKLFFSLYFSYGVGYFSHHKINWLSLWRGLTKFLCHLLRFDAVLEFRGSVQHIIMVLRNILSNLLLLSAASLFAATP